MNAYIPLCFFAMVIMSCQADSSNLELSSLESYNRRLQNPLVNNLLSKHNPGQLDHDNLKATRQGKLLQPPVPRNLKEPYDLHHLRRFGYVPAYGLAGIGGGIGGGAGINAGLSAGIDAGLSAGIGGGIGGGVGGGLGGYGYGGLGYPVYG